MFSNIGRKIKFLAKALCGIGIAASIITAIVLFASQDYKHNNTGTGFIVLLGGSLASWLGSFFTYGFGELIDKVTVIADNLPSLNHGTSRSNQLEERKNKRSETKIDQLHKRGIISDEEYSSLIEKHQTKKVNNE